MFHSRAAVLFKQKKKLKIIDIKNIKNLKYGQVQVRLVTSGICGAQINEINGIKGEDKYIPHLMGHEGYGIVERVGPGVKKVKINNQVVLHWRKSSGINAESAKFESKFGIINSGNVTTFSERTIVSENRLTKFKPRNKNEELLAPLLGCAIPTALFLIKKESSILSTNKNSSILINGIGGLGLTIAICLKVLGYKNISFLEKFNYKKKFISKLNVTFYNLFSKKLKNKKFSYVIDTTGNIDVISNSFNLLYKKSELILVGQPKIGNKLTIKNPLSFFDGKKIFASDGGGYEPAEDFIKMVKIVRKNLNLFKILISDIIPLDKINIGINKIKKGKSMRIIIKL
jgi:S-(hydroxymethyl)glutathione dehydrogenase / alcohol dehydrogenase